MKTKQPGGFLQRPAGVTDTYHCPDRVEVTVARRWVALRTQSTVTALVRACFPVVTV